MLNIFLYEIACMLQAGLDVDHQRRDGASPLWIAAQVRVLLEAYGGVTSLDCCTGTGTTRGVWVRHLSGLEYTVQVRVLLGASPLWIPVVPHGAVVH